jgi:hypothetical protein
VLGAALSLGAAACGGAANAPARQARHLEPHWQDILDSVPELLVVVRPKALQGDRVYGPLFKRAIAAARERSRVVEAMHPLDTLLDAEQVVVGVHPEARDRPAELMLAALGVRADVDPEKLVDDDGHAIWTAGPSSAMRELVHESDSHGHSVDASLFELPGRTWVVASGPARARAREVFAHPMNRPAPELDPAALASVRLDGPALVEHVRGLQDLGTFAAIGRRLRSVMFVLPPGGEGAVKVTLTYADEDAAAFSEVTLRQTATAIARAKSERLAWLGAAKVERPDKRVVVTAPLPAALIEGLLGAGSAPLDLDGATPPATVAP